MAKSLFIVSNAKQDLSYFCITEVKLHSAAHKSQLHAAAQLLTLSSWIYSRGGVHAAHKLPTGRATPFSLATLPSVANRCT